jgi:putative membrane protein
MKASNGRPRGASRQSATGVVLGVILVAYALARVLENLHSSLPSVAIVSLDVLSAAAFAYVHGKLHYRLKGILVFVGLCILVGNFSENLSVETGFPFGHYVFNDLMGPKMWNVPILLGLAYIGMAYVSWTLARLIVGDPYATVSGSRIVTLPLVASCIMVAWDVAQDPVWGTVLHAWTWRDGGPWFGVPVSNYFGWFANVFVIYLLFALFLKRRPELGVPVVHPMWGAAIFFYVLCAAGNVLQRFARPASETVFDPAGKIWLVADITTASAVVSIFVMGGFATLAMVRMQGPKGPL